MTVREQVGVAAQRASYRLAMRVEAYERDNAAAHRAILTSVRDVAVRCADRAHAAVGTDPRSPVFDPRRSTAWGGLRAELGGTVRRELRRRSRTVRRAGRLARSVRSPGRALFSAVLGRPLRAVRTGLWLLVLLLLLLALLWKFAVPGPVKYGLGKIIPGSVSCGPQVVPAGGLVGASWGAGDTLRGLASWEPDAEQIREALHAAAVAAGQAWGLFRGALDGLVEQPTTTVQPSVAAASAGCAAPCGTVPAAATAAGPTSLTGIAGAAAAIVGAGQRGETAAIYVAIAGAESTWNPRAVNPRSSARGYWQLMTSVHRITEAQAFDPAFAARFAVKLKADSPRGFAGPWAQTISKVGPLMPASRRAVGQAEAQLRTVAAECAPGTVSAGGAAGPWGGHTNGVIPAGALCPTSVGGRLRCDAAAGLSAMATAYQQAFGEPLVLSDSYRDMAGQRAVAASKPGLAAVPGRSQHGWGLAVDLGVPGGFDGAVYQWLTANGPAFGWVNPGWAQRGGSKPEFWHWEHVGAPSADPTVVA